MAQPSNANDVYYQKLTDYGRQRGEPEPIFKVTETSFKPSRIRGKNWNDVCINIELDVYEEDLELFRSFKATPKKLQAHLAYMTSEAKRKTEVIFSRLTADEKQQFLEAKNKELDQWISHAVFKVAKRAGVPTSRQAKSRSAYTQ